MSQPPVMQRVGTRYVARREQRMGPGVARVDPHRLDATEQQALLRIQWRLVAKAVLLGAASATICAVAELWADANLPINPTMGWKGHARYWAFLGGVIGCASLLEVLMLYLGSLQAVHALARTAGVPLRLVSTDPEPSSPMAAALVRAALELPNPPPEGVAIDPLREVSRVRALAIGGLYKAKVGLTSFALKLLLRRVAGRAALRAWLVFVGVPVTAFWNGVVAFVVIREARLRAIGPSAARRLCAVLELRSQSAAGTELVWRAVAASVVRTHELHPNVAEFIEAIAEDVGPPPADELDDTRLFLRRLAAAPAKDQRLALRALAVAAALDGKISGDERRLLVEAAEATGLSMPPQALARLRRSFVSGEDLDEGLLHSIAR